MALRAMKQSMADIKGNAAVSGKKALAILSVSDNTITGEQLPAKQRALGLDQMIHLALEIA